MQVDNVNKPAHYQQGTVECIEAIMSALTPEEWRGFCKGNIIKYTWRERYKGQDESIAKAIWYAQQITEDHHERSEVAGCSGQHR